MAVNHPAGENVGVPQKPHRRGHVPGFNLTADIGAGHTDAVHHLIRHHRPGKIPGFAVIPEGSGIAGSPVAEAEVLAADESGGVQLPQEHIQKIRPGHGAHLFVKGKRHHTVHGKPLPQKRFPVGGGVNQRRGISQHQRIRMGGEGHHPGPAAVFRRQTAALGQQRGVSDMHPVKKTQGENCLVHWITR